MLEIFENHNKHWISVKAFEKDDPNLSKIKKTRYWFNYPFDQRPPLKEAGIFTLTGGRQLGKTTSLKRAMLLALQAGIAPDAIFYIACDMINDRQHLYQLIKNFLAQAPKTFKYLCIDEVSYVKDWQLSIKALADEGEFRNTVCVISGSDKILIEDSIKFLPGRRGESPQLDYIHKPLKYDDFLSLTHQRQSLESFLLYLKCGGYLTAINELLVTGQISKSTKQVYQQWVVGDLLRLGKSQKNLKQVLFAVYETYGSQVSYINLANHTDGLNKDTISEYLEILSRLGVLTVQFALDQNSLGPAPKKNKKVHFSDPFISEALFEYVASEYPSVKNLLEPQLVESVCYNHFRSLYNTYYIKAEGEVDIAYIKGRSFWPVEIKWTKSLKANDLKQIAKYKNGVILGRDDAETTIRGIKCLPLIKYLAENEALAVNV